MHNLASPRGRPIVHLSVHDVACRSAIIEALQRGGWTAVEHATGFDLLHALSPLILGDGPAERPSLIVVDVISRGCAGATIAFGLLELGVEIPMILVRGPGDPIEPLHTHRIRIVDCDRVAEVIEDVVHQMREDARHVRALSDGDRVVVAPIQQMTRDRWRAEDASRTVAACPSSRR